MSGYTGDGWRQEREIVGTNEDAAILNEATACRPSYGDNGS